MIKGIAHVALGTTDFDKSCAFYADSLKLFMLGGAKNRNDVF